MNSFQGFENGKHNVKRDQNHIKNRRFWFEQHLHSGYAPAYALRVARIRGPRAICYGKTIRASNRPLECRGHPVWNGDGSTAVSHVTRLQDLISGTQEVLTRADQSRTSAPASKGPCHLHFG